MLGPGGATEIQPRKGCLNERVEFFDHNASIRERGDS